MTPHSPKPDQSKLGSPSPLMPLPEVERSPERRSLSYQNIYLCPICRHGQISAIPLMEAFSCDFCRHIFTANLTEQVVRVEDSSQPMTWRWNGQTWQSTNLLSPDLTITLWIVGSVLVLVPTALVWLSSYLFPPLAGSAWVWFPQVWVGFTFLAHFSFVGWLLVEYYQFPPYVSCKVRLQDWRRRQSV